ncbi:MAG: hypothetical protein M1838_000640, partial [Thelocarpon superellum]
MDDAEAALQQQLPAALRQLQPDALHGVHHASAHHGHGLTSQLPPELQSLDAVDPNGFHERLPVELGDPGQGHPLQTSAASFDHNPSASLQPRGSAVTHPHTPQHASHGGQFGILTPGPPLTSQILRTPSSLTRLQHPDSELFATPESAGAKRDGHLDGLKIVPSPPNLAEWRAKLFDVSETITLTEEEQVAPPRYQTYFPHVDNVYSHRSTQRYKRKPFVSHYWDCRLKGRPPGTPKSEDPNKKKRKRTARERDLCDVKIKITEYFPGAV